MAGESRTFQKKFRSYEPTGFQVPVARTSMNSPPDRFVLPTGIWITPKPLLRYDLALQARLRTFDRWICRSGLCGCWA